MFNMDKYREEFESLAIAICADHKNWLKNNVYFKGKTYVPINHKNDFHCQHSAYFGFAFLMFCQQQKKIDELQKQIDIMQEKINEVVDYIGDDFDDFYLGETNSDIHKILTADLEQALKGDNFH